MWRPIDRSDRPLRVVLWGVCNTPLQGDNRKRKMNDEKIRYPAKLAGIPDEPFRGWEIWQASLMP